MEITSILKKYDQNDLTIGVLGGHSALDVSHGAKKYGFKTVCIARRGREKTYERYYKSRVSPFDGASSFASLRKDRQGDTNFSVSSRTQSRDNTENSIGCIDETILVDKFLDVLNPNIQDKLKSLNTIFVHNRYFWVYFDDFSKVENNFNIPIFGSRTLLKLEERDQPYNQYHLLKDAGIRTPKIFKKPEDIDRPVLVKAAEAKRGYERAFFVAHNKESWESEGNRLEKENQINAKWRKAPVEEFIVGAPINFNYFYSPLTKELELLGTDTRRQTNLDGYLRMTAPDQTKALFYGRPKMIETGHIACTVKESILEKAFAMGEDFVRATQKLPKELDPSGKGIIGPFALQGAVTADEGKEDIVIFDVSLRIPGSPGTFATPYSRYLYGETMSVGERIGMEIRSAQSAGALEKIIT